MKRRNRIACLAATALWPLAAGAADAPTAAAPAKGHVEEITVTAQKRTENVRKVPLSVTVLSGRQIKAAHIQNFADLTRAVPNLSFSSQAGEGLSTLELRGIASQAGTATVAVYLDDVSLTTRNLYTDGAAEPRFLDISRIEVLRGPQGTLYGASALGGTLKYISNPPVMDKYEGSLFSELSGTYHGGLNFDEQGVLNIPLAPGRAALRISGETGEDSGYIDHIDPATGATNKQNINSNNFSDARATLLLTPNDWLTITPAAFWQKDISHDSDAQYLALPSFQTPKQVAEPGHDTLFVPSLTVDADLGFANLISVTSNYNRFFRRTLDSSLFDSLGLYVCNPENPVDFCGSGAPNGLYGALNNRPSSTFYNNQVRQWAQEVRLVSKPYVPGGTPFTWLVGLYYSDEHTTDSDVETIQNVNGILQQFGANPNDPNVLGGSFPNAVVNNYVFHGSQSYDTAQYAIFGESTYYAAPNLRFTAGARYLFARDGENSNEQQFYSYGLNGPTSSVGHFYAFTPKFAFGWDLTPDNTIYANITKGVRLGSENRRVEYIPAEAGAFGTPSYDLHNLGITSLPVNYGPDKLWNFEVGDKGRFFGGRLVASADVFYIKWDQIQQQIPLVTAGSFFETNAGAAQSFGFEFEMNSHLTDDLTAGLSGSATHATLDNGVVVGGTRLAGTYKGEWVPGVPNYNLDLTARQNFIVNDRISGFAAIDIPWVGESDGNVINTNPDYRRPSYITLDASTGIDIGRWEFTLFGKNLTNNTKIIQRPDIQGSSTGGYGLTYLGNFIPNTQGFTLRPLTVGMNATLKF